MFYGRHECLPTDRRFTYKPDRVEFRSYNPRHLFVRKRNGGVARRRYVVAACREMFIERETSVRHARPMPTQCLLALPAARNGICQARRYTQFATFRGGAMFVEVEQHADLLLCGVRLLRGAAPTNTRAGKSLYMPGGREIRQVLSRRKQQRRVLAAEIRVVCGPVFVPVLRFSVVLRRAIA